MIPWNVLASIRIRKTTVKTHNSGSSILFLNVSLTQPTKLSTTNRVVFWTDSPFTGTPRSSLFSFRGPTWDLARKPVVFTTLWMIYFCFLILSHVHKIGTEKCPSSVVFSWSANGKNSEPGNHLSPSEIPRHLVTITSLRNFWASTLQTNHEVICLFIDWLQLFSTNEKWTKWDTYCNSKEIRLNWSKMNNRHISGQINCY